MKKSIALLLCVAMILVLAAGCGGSGKTGADAEAPAAEGGEAAAPAAEAAPAEEGEKVFVYGADANAAMFDPYGEMQVKSSAALESCVSEQLWTIDHEGNVVFNKLVESYEWTGDLELTLHLREGVTYSNGNPFNADDVIFSFHLMQGAMRTMSMVANIDFDATTCPDDYTVVLEFTAFDAGFIDTMSSVSFPILDKETVEADPGYTWFVGTGPYVLSEWEESVQYVLTRNENYWGEAPYYDKIIIKFYSDESTLYADFQTGNLDAVYLTESTYINNLGNGFVTGAHLVQLDKPGVMGFPLAVDGGSKERETFADINVRKAFAHAIDVETIVNELGEGTRTVASGLLPSGTWAALDTGIYAYDPELAAECLAAAGYGVDNPLSIEVVAEGTSWNRAICEAAQEYLAAIGINLDLTNLGDFSTILPSLISGEMDTSVGGPSNGSGNDPAALLQKFGPLSDDSLNNIGDPDISALWVSASTSRDQAERAELYKEFQQAVYDNYLFIPVYNDSVNFGVQDVHASFESCLDANQNFDLTLLTD